MFRYLRRIHCVKYEMKCSQGTNQMMQLRVLYVKVTFSCVSEENLLFDLRISSASL